MDTQTILILVAAGVFYIYYIFLRNRNLLKKEVLEDFIKEGKGYLLLDVRTASEFKSGHIESARNVPHDKLPKALKKKNKSEPVIVYCQSGSRARVAARLLKGAGYTDVRNFGGINRWRAPLVS